MEDVFGNVIAAVGIVLVFTGIAVEALKKAEIVAIKYLPTVSILLGIACGIAWALGFNQDLPTFIAAGFIAGASASGIYDNLKTLKASTLKGGK